MSNSGRIAAVAVIAVVAFGAAFLLTGGDDEPAPSTDVAAGASTSTTAAASGSGSAAGGSDNPCVVDDVVPAADAGYQVTVATEPDPPVPQGTTFEVLVERDGAPVSGATLCLRADMSEMSHEGTSAQADEVGDGRYEMSVDFGMRGAWSGSLLVIESGQGASTPVSFNVQ